MSLHMTRFQMLVLVFALPLLAVAQGNYSATTSGVSGTSTAATPSVTSFEQSVEDLWNLYVGPIEPAATNTTVAATPIPSESLVPPPPIHYPTFPTGQQLPAVITNSSWKFPSDFIWGVCSAAYQIEGAVKDEGRGPSVWDVFTNRVTNFVFGNYTANVADNEYYLYKEDIARIAALGVPYYSFSISWSRIFPFGSGQINEAGLKHYDDLIQTCFDYGVEPIVTLYHWDTPLVLQNTYGGWLSPQIIDDYTAYAHVLFSRWGNKIKHWFTLNEITVFCGQYYPMPDGYFRSSSIPRSEQQFHCAHNALLAHASAYRLARSMGINGTMTIKNNGGYKVPLTNSSADILATQRAWDFNENWFAHPIYIDGDYPPYLKRYVNSIGLTFTDAQKAMLNGSSDIFAHDAYSAAFYMAPDGGIDACLSNSSHPLYPGCFNSTIQYPVSSGSWAIGPAADPSTNAWLYRTADWLPAFLSYIQTTWSRGMPIIISEVGWAEPFAYYRPTLADQLYDIDRWAYYTQYIEATLIAISEGVNVKGLLAWTLADNFEWKTGFQAKFGLMYVNFTQPGLPRYYRASFFGLADMFRRYGARMNEVGLKVVGW